jgi:hypothetical protein
LPIVSNWSPLDLARSKMPGPRIDGYELTALEALMEANRDRPCVLFRDYVRVPNFAPGS